MEQEIRFCLAPDGVRIAYATVGGGPPLVKAANYVSHLQHDWDGPVWRHWLRDLSRHHMLARYDERGCGLSDRDVTEFSIDAWVSDLEAVVNALDLQRFPLLGISQGAAVSVAYAARHPEKVSHLILYGGYARGRLKRAQTPEAIQEAETMIDVIRVGWGQENPAFRQLFTTQVMPNATSEQMKWLNELARISVTPETAAAMERAFYHIDVTDLARQVIAPTLVLHARGDAAVPFDEGRQLAALIPAARFVPMDSKNHILLQDEPAWPHFLAEINEFLGVVQTGAARSQEGQVIPVLTPRERAIHEFVLEERIGAGGMGEVFRAVNTHNGEYVAIKRLGLTTAADHLERFQLECDLLGYLDHPSIVKQLDAFEYEGRSYIVMEYVPGGSLRDLLDVTPQLPLENILWLSLDLADALTRAHRLGIVHRDLKPENVLLAEDGTPRLTDFGVARWLTGTGPTTTGLLVGTPDYMSPEAINGQAMDERADIWSFGVLLFEMLAGRPPFVAELLTTLLHDIVYAPFPDLATLRPDAPPGLADLIHKMLERDVEARIASMRLVGAELEALLRSEGWPGSRRA